MAETNNANYALIISLTLRFYAFENVRGGIIYDLWEIMGRKIPPECKYFRLPREFLPAKAAREGSDWKYCEIMTVYLQMKRFYYTDTGRSQPWDFQRMWDMTLVEENIAICYALAESISFKLNEKPTIFKSAFPDGSLAYVSKINCPMFAVINFGLPILNEILDFPMVIVKGPLIKRSKYGQTYIVADNLGNFMDVIMYEKSSKRCRIKNFCFIFHIYDNEQLIKNMKSVINNKKKNRVYRFELAKNVLDDVTGNDKYLLQQVQKKSREVKGKKYSKLGDIFHGLSNCSCIPCTRNKLVKNSDERVKNEGNTVPKSNSGGPSTNTHLNRRLLKSKNLKVKNLNKKKTNSYDPPDTITPGSSGPKEAGSSNERSSSNRLKKGKNVKTRMKNNNDEKTAQLDSVNETESSAVEIKSNNVRGNSEAELNNTGEGELKTVEKKFTKSRAKDKVNLDTLSEPEIGKSASIREKGKAKLDTVECENNLTNIRKKGKEKLDTVESDIESTSILGKGKASFHTGECKNKLMIIREKGKAKLDNVECENKLTNISEKGKEKLDTGESEIESTSILGKGKASFHTGECKNKLMIIREKGKAKLDTGGSENESTSICGKGKARFHTGECKNKLTSIREKGMVKFNTGECENKWTSICEKNKAKLNISECDSESISMRGKDKAKLDTGKCDNQSISTRGKDKAKLNTGECDNESISIRRRVKLSTEVKMNPQGEKDKAK